MKYALFVALVVFAVAAPRAQAADNGVIETDYLEKAVVTSVSPSHYETVDGTDVTAEVQTLTVRVLSGPDKGATPVFANDYTQLTEGDLLYVRHTTGGDAPDTWSVSDPYRLPVLEILLALFLVSTVLIGGWQGLRALATLSGSFLLILFVLLPGISHGYSAVGVSTAVAAAIIVLGSYVTHGWNRTTTAAVLGMLATLAVSTLLAWWAVHAGKLSGFTTEDNVYLNFNTNGSIDMIGLLEGGIMIGLLGILYDVAIGQAVAVEELMSVGAHLRKQSIVRKALRIGREHIGALVNTLAIAYVGASLPILLLFMNANTGIGYVMNNELFATEVVRILVGSIGLILAVPITTVIASYLLYTKRSTTSEKQETP